MYDKEVNRILQQTAPEDLLQSLPILKWVQSEEDPLKISVFLVCHYRKNVSKFFYDMVSRWLIPGNHLNVGLNFSTQVNLPEYGEEQFTVCELVLLLDNVQEIAHAKHNFPFLEREILMGAHSFYHATKILEMKGLALDDKISLVQEKIAALVGRFPQDFDYDIFGEMQQFFVSSKGGFKAVRQPSQISRIIFTLYRIRKTLEKRTNEEPRRRHLSLKWKKTLLHTPFGLKEVLSIFVGLNFLKEHELFEERHLLSALAHFIPGIQSIPDSYFSNDGENENIHCFYLEIEKENRRPFSKQELLQLKNELTKEIHSRIEQLVPPIFMPRNEEEVMRGILVLSHQLKYLRDLPQMIISFDEQTDTELSFTVIIVRIVHPESLSIRELFENSRLSHVLSIDRVKLVGRIRRKYPKEASVLRVRLQVEDFIRKDYSVDLFRARLHLVQEIESVLGDVRDYNGGMISKQSENFDALKKVMGRLASKHALLLQNYFHSIFPVSLSTTLDPHLLKILFSMLLEAIDRSQESTFLQSKKANDHLFVMVKIQDFSWKQKIYNQIEALKLPSNELLTVQMQIFDSFYLGMLYLNPEKEKQKIFLETIPDLTFPKNLRY